MAAVPEGDAVIHVDRLTAETVPETKQFLAAGDLRSYLFARESVSDLLDRALTNPDRSVVFTWKAGGAVMGLSGLVIDSASAEAEIWCVGINWPSSWMYVKGAAESMVRQAFKDLKLEAVRASCERSDSVAVQALRDSGFFEEGTQYRPVAAGRRAADRMLFGVLRSDWQADATKRPTGLIARARWDDRYPFYIYLILQCAFIVVLDYIAFVANGWFALFLAFVLEVVVGSFDWQLLRRIRDERLIGPKIISPGALCSFGFSVVGLLAAVYRVRWSGGFSAAWLVIGFSVVAVGALQAAAMLRSWRGRLPWLWIGALMMAAPMICVWLPLSDSASQWTTMNSKGFDNWRAGGADRVRVVAERSAWTVKVAGKQPRVALALSGGGYRAALIHAGVLAALDRRHIPVSYLTTVSGGSIIGAYYALGYRPADFIRLTWEQKPGLILDKLSLFALLESWLVPWASSADVYADHFARFYFGTAKLHDLPNVPVLIVNATDIEASPQNAREIFSRDIAEQSGELARSTRVADVVAASGAFPGAFEPKVIRWFESGSDPRGGKIVRRHFVDGGVLENVGLEGLRRYLKTRRELNLEVDKPDVLIVSDASLASEFTPLPNKPELTDVLARVQDISYSALQRSLVSQFTGKADYGRWMAETPFSSQVAQVPYASIDPALAAGEPQVLKVVMIPATAPEMTRKLRGSPQNGCAYRGHSIADIQHQVAGFATLKELSRPDIEMASWLGSALVNLYSGAIDCALDKAGSPEKGCSAAQPTTATCPSFEDIARLHRD